MDVQDGFIVGIFNYCDRWCEVCQFTSRCRLFADCAEAEASIDRNFAALREAPPLPEDVPPPPPRWMQEIIDDMKRGGANGTNRGGVGKVTAEGRAGARTNREAGGRSPNVHRALTGLADDDPDLREWPADHDGSAKIALIGIDRSHAAWLQAVEQGVISHAAVQPFIADLIWLGDALERVFSEGSLRAAGSR